MELMPWNVLTRTFKQNPKTSGNTQHHREGRQAGVTRGRFLSWAYWEKGPRTACKWSLKTRSKKKKKKKTLITWLCKRRTDTCAWTSSWRLSWLPLRHTQSTPHFKRSNNHVSSVACVGEGTDVPMRSHWRLVSWYLKQWFSTRG